MSDDIRFDLNPDEETDLTHQIDETTLLYGRPDFAVAPPGLPGIAAGEKLYIAQVSLAVMVCPNCGASGTKHKTTFKETDVVAISCMDCRQFCWYQERKER